YVIDGEDAERRDNCFAQYILQTLQYLPVHQTKVTEKWQQAKIPNELLEPSKQVLDKDQYKDELSKLTKKVADALRYYDRKVIVELEVMDAEGKGGE
ncbi:phosphate--AMP phosphotransferase, partial [Acinetobacter ursingii]